MELDQPDILCRPSSQSEPVAYLPRIADGVAQIVANTGTTSTAAHCR